GYFFDKPSVSGRTAAETVAVVQWTNQNLRAPGSNLNGPGRDCSKVDVAVFKCFRDGKTNCLDQCGSPPQPTEAVPTIAPVPVTIDPTQSGDPCVNASVGGPGSVAISVSGNPPATVATLGGNDSACFSRIFGGAFISLQGVVVICSSPSTCAL